MTAAIVDLPYGYRDDPAGREGLAALAARWVASDPGGWKTRHRLEPYASSFSFWSALDDLGGLPGHFRSAMRPPSEDRLGPLREAQQRLIGRRSGNFYLRMLDAIETAAYGSPAEDPLGTAESTRAVSAADVSGYLDRCRDAGLLFYPGAGSRPPSPPTRPCRGGTPPSPPGRPWRGGAPPSLPSPPARPWRGGVEVVEVAGESRTRVAVRIPLDSAAPRPGALPLLVELLGSNAEGRLIRRLRRDRGLAYGVAALAWTQDGEVSIGGHALVRPEHAGEAADLLLDTVREALVEPPGPELTAAAVRCRTLQLVQVDQPFGAITDHRTVARGGTSLVRVADDVAACAAGGLDLRTAVGAAPARAVVGAITGAITGASS